MEKAGMEIRVIGGGLKVLRETAGGVGERLRWAQRSLGRVAGSPEDTHTHTYCISLSQSLALP